MDQILQGTQETTMQLARPNGLQLLAQDRNPQNQLQFIIWINSVNLSAIALGEGIKTVYEKIASRDRQLATRLASCRQQALFRQTHGFQIEALGPAKEGHTVAEKLEVSLLARIHH